MKMYHLLLICFLLVNCYGNQLNTMMLSSDKTQPPGPIYEDPYRSPNPYKNYKLEREYNYKDIYATMIIIPIFEQSNENRYYIF
jgi:hypothetical protein